MPKEAIRMQAVPPPTMKRAGIEMIRSEIAKKPKEATLTKLQTALRVAEREDKEAEYDECLDAIKDARKALGR